MRLRRAARALPAAAGRGRARAARRRCVDAGSTGDPGRLHDGGPGRRRRGRPRRREGRWSLDAAGADFFLVATADGRRHLVDAGADGRDGQRRKISIDPTRRLSSVRFDGRPRRRRRHAARPTAPSTSRSSTASASRSPPSRPGSPSGRWRWRSSTPKTASSSAARSAPTRRSPTAARRCCWRPRTRARPSTAPPGPPTPSPTSLPLAASMAKAYASDAGWRVPDASIQVHGGIGFTWEHDLHFFLKRGRANAALFGDAKWHRERVADAVLAAAAPAGLRVAWAPSTASPSPRSAPRSPTSRPRRCAPRRPASSASGRRSCSAAPSPRPPTWRRRPSGSGSRPGSSGPSPAAPSSTRSAPSTSTRCRAGASASGWAPGSNG